MKKILKQVVGIDVAQKELVITLGQLTEDLSVECHSSKTFPNNTKGFMSLVSWVGKWSDAELPVHYVMEATGVYHESLAYFLNEKGHLLSIVLPNKISNYFRSLPEKSITDTTSSQAIARFGLERSLEQWNKPNDTYKKLRQLCREREQVIDHRTMSKNQLHAEEAEAQPNKGTVSRIKKQIQFFNQQEQQIRKEITDLIRQEESITRVVKLLCSLSGIGTLTAASVLGETNGFDLIKNRRQLASYAGLDVREKQSGTSIKGKPRISKRGNKHLRKTMHMPALAAIRSDERFKNIFTRLVSKHGIKMKAVVAVQRKLLELMYIVYKNQTPYDKEYFKKLESNMVAP